MELRFGTTCLQAQPYLGISERYRDGQPRCDHGPLFGELCSYIKESGKTLAGIPVAIHHSMDGGNVDVECGMPVAEPMSGTERIRGGMLPGGTVATVTHLGPYDDLPGTWSALTAWMQAQGLEAAGAPWEVYVTDPGAEPDTSKWRTDIYFPVC